MKAWALLGCATFLITFGVLNVGLLSSEPATVTVPSTSPVASVPASTVAPLVPRGQGHGACRARGVLPDPTCTPGATNLDVTPATLAATICRPGWTATVRPPTAWSGPVKLERIAEYGLPGAPGVYELDHLVPLELGGAPASVANLWPEPWPDARRKDVVEDRLKREVCAGLVDLRVAQRAIAADWTTAR